jgi:hypothetical protein
MTSSSNGASRCHAPSINRLRESVEMDEEEREDLLAFAPCVMFLNHDGGSDHKNTNVQNIAAYVAFVEFLGLHMLVNNRNAPDDSYVNYVKRYNSVLNIALAHHAYARGAYDTLEQAVKRCNSMKALCDLWKRNSKVNIEWAATLAPMLATA